MTRVFDCFPFFNELDVLEIRLHEHADVVDRFVIAESTVTFAGEPKPLVFQENRERFAAFADRIAHIVVPDAPPELATRWGRERYQRDVLIQGLADAAPDDLVIVADADEILRHDVIRAMRDDATIGSGVFCPELRMFNYFVNYERDEPLLRTGPRAARRRSFTSMWGLRSVRGPAPGLRNVSRFMHNWRAMGRPTRTRFVRDAGWHFTYLGDASDIAGKIRARTSFAEGRPTFDSPTLAARIAAGIESDEVRERTNRLSYVPLDASFPSYLVENRARFARYVLDRPPQEQALPNR